MPRLLSLAFASLAVTALTVFGGASRAAGSERWTAISSTAEAITGDVTFAPGRITFANGAHVEIAYARTLHRATWVGLPTEGAPIVVYRMLGTRDPVLSHGNRLCGSTPAFASVVRSRHRTTSPQSDEIALAIFTGDPAPRGRAETRVCATYTYASRRAGY